MVNRANYNGTQKKLMISARKTADFLRLSDNTLKPALQAEWIIPQQEFRRGNKVERGFVVAYLREVKKILPKPRGPGIAIFTPKVIEKLGKLKEEWIGRKVDWEKDRLDSIQLEKDLAGVK